MKSNFYILFKTYRDKQLIKQQQLAKQTENYDGERKEESEFEQKPLLKFNEFNDEKRQSWNKFVEKKTKNEKQCWTRSETLKKKKN